MKEQKIGNDFGAEIIQFTYEYNHGMIKMYESV